MRITEIICEKVVRLDDETGETFIVTVNPTRQQFFRDTSNPDCDMKGLVTKDDFYYWPAWHAHHNQIAYRLGLIDAKCIFVQHNAICSTLDHKDLIMHNRELNWLFNGKVPFYPTTP